jgi:hypothetical protein
MGTRGSSHGGKAVGLWGLHWPTIIADAKETWIYTSTPHTPSWRTAYLVMHRDNFTSKSITSCINCEDNLVASIWERSWIFWWIWIGRAASEARSSVLRHENPLQNRLICGGKPRKPLSRWLVVTGKRINGEGTTKMTVTWGGGNTSIGLSTRHCLEPVCPQELSTFITWT